MQKEAKARIKINGLLQNAGWRFFDDEKGTANIVLENNVKITQKEIDEYGNDFEKINKGFIDFLLLDEKGFPLVVLEAKSEDKEPLDGKEQARKYAQSQNIRFVILSNGNLHYFWDLESGNPQIITTFPTPQSLLHSQTFKPNGEKLSAEKVESDYVVLTQNPKYKDDPRWLHDTERKNFIEEQGLKFLRPYQLAAIQHLQNSAKKGNTRFLFEMATGTGKTLVSAAILKLFLRTGNAKRILFLVDRLELEDQAWKNMVRYLKNDYKCVIYKENRDDWRSADIVVTTVQSLSFNNKYQKLFSPTDFDLIISDEAHRSIGGNSRAVFEYFVGYKLGLTATPKDYLKKLDVSKASYSDPRQWERRQLLDTYRTFGCESNEPTFRYSLIDGVKDGYLVNPVVADARTEITTQLLSDEGYNIKTTNENNEEVEEIYFQKDFERNFFSEETNTIFCQTFLDNAIKDPLSGEIGKTIIFCVSQKHASKITQTLNKLAHDRWPEKYNSDFAIQVTANIPEAKQFTNDFSDKSNNLSGNSRFLEDYKTSKTRVCVTVGMMTTGYDCQDILNLCLMRPIFSPTDFIQIKGRGTRKFTFIFKQKIAGDTEETTAEKTVYKIFDYFANFEYFEEKYDYDEILELPRKSGTTGGPPKPPAGIKSATLTQPDPLKSLEEQTIGPEGMKVDRKLFDNFEEKVKSDNFARESYERGDLETVEDYIKTKLFDKPEDYINLDKLRKSIRADRRITLREIIEKIFGGISRFKSKDELLEEEFAKFVAIYKPENKDVYPIKNYLKAYITDNEVRDIVESGEYGRFATNPKVSMADFKQLGNWREVVPEYVKDYVTLNTFL